MLDWQELPSHLLEGQFRKPYFVLIALALAGIVFPFALIVSLALWLRRTPSVLSNAFKKGLRDGVKSAFSQVAWENHPWGIAQLLSITLILVLQVLLGWLAKNRFLNKNDGKGNVLL
jgi:hypothetical protein